MALQLLKDGKTFADINSEKPKICFLHGWGGSSSDFSLITNNFESIAIDLPGFGKSKEPESSMNPKEYAEYIINLIPDTVEFSWPFIWWKSSSSYVIYEKLQKSCTNWFTFN